MQSNIVILKENRYSFSPLISIADYFNSKIEIINLKDCAFKGEDEFSDEYLFNYIDSQLKDFKVNDDLNIFFFSIHSWYRKFFLLVLKILKEKFPDSLFIAGGPDVIATPLLYSNYFDLVCKGEGESFLIDLFYLLSEFDKKYSIEINIEDISNAVSKFKSIKILKNNQKILLEKEYSNRIIFSEKTLNLDIYKYFLKDYYYKFIGKIILSDFNVKINTTLDEKIEKIKKEDEIFIFFPSFPIKTSFFHPIEIIRGCPQRCKYCQVSNIFGHKYRKKDLDIVKIFIKYQLLHKKNHVRFISPDFALYFEKNRLDTADNFIEDNLESFINFIKNEGENNNLDVFIYLGSFPSELSLRFLKLDLLDLIAKYSSTKKITIGIQTASKRLQKIIGRNDPLDELENILIKSLNLGLEPIIDIIFGLPYENEEDRDITLSFLEKNLNNKVSANIHYFLPLPGSEFGNETPTRLSSTEIKRINKLLSKGLVSGNFYRQMNEFKFRLQIPTQYLQNL